MRLGLSRVEEQEGEGRQGEDPVPIVAAELAGLKAQWDCEPEWGAGLNPLHGSGDESLLGSLLVGEMHRNAPVMPMLGPCRAIGLTARGCTRNAGSRRSSAAADRRTVPRFVSRKIRRGGLAVAGQTLPTGPRGLGTRARADAVEHLCAPTDECRPLLRNRGNESNSFHVHRKSIGQPPAPHPEVPDSR